MGIPVEVYEAIEDVLGKEPARKLVHGLERAIESALTVRLTELKDELFEKLVTREVFRAELHAQTQQLRTEFQEQIHGLRTEFREQIHGLRTELQGQIHGLQERITALEERFRRLDLKMNYVLILLVLLLTLMNPTFAHLVQRLLGL